MDNNEREQGVPADLLRQATSAPTGRNMEDYNPVENIPTLTPGDDWTEGMTVSGYYEETQVIASHKFKYATEKNEQGVPISRRIVLRVGSPTGPRLGLWGNAGELKLAFSKIVPGTLVSVTYKGKGKNAKEQDQHFFEFKREVTKH